MTNEKIQERLLQFSNFGAGPALLPASVKQAIQVAIDPTLATAENSPIWYDTNGTSRVKNDTLPLELCLLETSHRSKRIEWIIEDTKAQLKSLLFPSNATLAAEFDILFLPGGASFQFSTILLNLFPELFQGIPDDLLGDYIITGTWSKKAAEEAQLLGAQVNSVLQNNAYPSKDIYRYDLAFFKNSLSFSEKSKFIYFCANETIQGFKISINDIRQAKNAIEGKKLVICDMSSSLLTEPVSMEHFDVIFASAQKNLGIPGCTVVIIRKSLLVPTKLPSMLNFKVQADANSAYNTPPVLSIYSVNAMARYLSKNYGTLENLKNFHKKLCATLEGAIEMFPAVYTMVVKDPYFRSLTNVCWILKEKAKEKEFLRLAFDKDGILEIAGHRSVGGFRASLYNGATEAMVFTLASFLKEFAQNKF